MTALPGIESVLTGSVEDWVAALPPYQRVTIEALLKRAGTPEEAAQNWLAAAGPLDTARFGGTSRAAEILFGNLARETHKALCGSSEYEGDRGELSRATAAGKHAFASALGIVISPHLGAAAVVLVPALMLLLAIVTQAGQQSVCQMLSEIIERFEEASVSQDDQT